MTGRRTKRRYASELYPEPKDNRTAALDDLARRAYATALGFEVQGTGWFELRGTEAGNRILTLVYARQTATLIDAIAQGMTADEAWRWAYDHAADESGELVYDRAVFYGIDPNALKPYPCGPEPDKHDHYSEPDARGWRTVTAIAGKESDCEECTEPVEATDDAV
jgi:hypothetical protein